MRCNLVLVAIAALAGCSSPESSIESDCKRLKLFKNLDGADADKACACLTDKLKAELPGEELKDLAGRLKKARTRNDVNAPNFFKTSEIAFATVEAISACTPA